MIREKGKGKGKGKRKEGLEREVGKECLERGRGRKW